MNMHMHELTSEMFPRSTRLTKTFGMFFLTSSNVSLKFFSKSSGFNVGTSPEQLAIIIKAYHYNAYSIAVSIIYRTYPRQTSLAPTKTVISFQSFSISMLGCCVVEYTCAYGLSSQTSYLNKALLYQHTSVLSSKCYVGGSCISRDIDKSNSCLGTRPVSNYHNIQCIISY